MKTVIVQDDHLTAGAWAACGPALSGTVKKLKRSPLVKRPAVKVPRIFLLNYDNYELYQAVLVTLC